MRRGIVTIELIVAAGLLAVVLALLVPLLAGAARERQRLELRAIALQEAANLLEQAAALPWQDLKPGELQQIAISAEVAKLLPEVQAAVQVIDEPGTPAARKLSAKIRWKPEPGRPEPMANLVTWVYAGPTEISGDAAPGARP